MKVIIAVEFGRGSYQYCEGTTELPIECLFKSLYMVESRDSINKLVRGGDFTLSLSSYINPSDPDDKYYLSQRNPAIKETRDLKALKSDCDFLIFYDRYVEYHYESPYIVYEKGIETDKHVPTYYEKEQQERRESSKRLLNILKSIQNN